MPTLNPISIKIFDKLDYDFRASRHYLVSLMGA